MLSALRAPSAVAARCGSGSSKSSGSVKRKLVVSGFARPSSPASSSSASSAAPASQHADAPPTRRLRQRTSPDATAWTITTSAPHSSPPPGFLLGGQYSHNAPAGDAAAHAPLSVYGNFAVVGPCHALKLADGSLLVTLPAGGGGHVQLARTAGGGGGGDGAAMRLGAAALAAQGFGARPAAGEGGEDGQSGRLVLHGELMQLSGSYRVVRRVGSSGRSGGGGGGDSSSSDADDDGHDGGGSRGSVPRRAAVRRHCGGPALNSSWLNVLRVSALPVGAALVLEAGAALSHPLNATPPPSPPCSDAED